MVTYELKLMRGVSITKNDSTTNSVPRDISNTRPKMDAKNILLSNHHTDSNPTAHDIVRTEWKGKKTILYADVKALSIEAFILAYLFFFREERFPCLRTAIHALFLPTKKSDW